MGHDIKITHGGIIWDILREHYMGVILKNIKDYMGRVITPLKFNMEPKNWWLVDVSPFPFGGIFQET